MTSKKNYQFKIFLLFITCLYLPLRGANVEGVIKDAKSGEKIAYAYIVVEGTSVGALSDSAGYFKFPVPLGKHQIKVSYITHIAKIIEIDVKNNAHIKLEIDLEPNNLLSAIKVSAEKVKTTEEAVLVQMKEAQTIVSGISSEQISKNQDKDAAEVIRRIPGITLIDGRFIVIRGLSLRYNEVWINSGVTPSSESDSRAFSFDFVPSGMIENILVYKNFSADLPGDFAGGFVKIQTLDMPINNGFQIGYGVGFRTNSVFRPHRTYSKSGWNVVGGGSITRNIPREFSGNLNNVDLAQACKHAAKLPNNWNINKKTAMPDQSLSFSYNNTKKINNLTMANIVNFGYSYNEEHAILENNQFGIYNIQEGESIYSKKYNDTIYQENSKINLGYNLCFFTQNGHKIRFKNLLQNMGTNRTGFREGMNYSNNYHEKSQEFFYRNRLTYATQLEASHHFKDDNTSQFDWTLGYAYILNNEPDHRIIDARKNINESSPFYGMYRTMDNDVRRYFQHLTEHNASANINYNHLFNLEKITVGIKTGLYSEIKVRDFNARNFTYKKSMENDLTPEYFYLPYPEMFDLQYLNPKGFYLVEGTGKSDSYNALRSINAAYALLRLEFFNIALHAGLRVEQSLLTLDSYTSDGVNPVNIHKNTFHFFPSVNLSYTIKEKHVLRTAYGITTNRPELREIAPFVYYDFETFSTHQGNPDLKDAIIHNVDLRYEFYPNKEEMISFGAFYKKFINPIENTYYHAGGQYQYTYMNAYSAASYGLELDIRKSLDFMKLKNFSLVLNAALLKSEVLFPENSIELDRAMQGQSPFIVNTGLYYDNKSMGLTFSVLYNIIGRRIMAVGKMNQNANENIPNTYQMPRHSLDASIQQKVGKFKLYISARNILNQKVIYTQIGSYTTENSNVRNYRQNPKVIKTGVQVSTGFTVNF